MPRTSLHFAYAVATLAGTIIGAGIFGLPYVAKESGFVITAFFLLLLGGAVLTVHLVFGEIVLRTRERHRFPGYARVYVGGKTAAAAVLVDVVGVFGAMLAYLVVGGVFLHLIFGPMADVPVAWYVVVFWVLLSLAILRGLRTVARLELMLSIVLLLAFAIIAVVSFDKIEFSNLLHVSWDNAFAPYGVVLFALGGASAIPELREILRLETKLLRRAIVIGTVLPIVLFLGFTAVVLGVSGGATTQDALSGLARFLGSGIVLPIAVFGVASVASSYLVMGLYLKNVFHLDLGARKGVAGALVTVIPIGVYLAGVTNFIGILTFIGAVTGGAAYLLFFFVYNHARTRGDRAPEYRLAFSPILLYTIAAVFGAGIVYYLLTSF